MPNPMPNKTIEGKRYIDCSRCGQAMQVSGDGPERVISYFNYENAVLCLHCNKVRKFDDENPILHPFYEPITPHQ